MNEEDLTADIDAAMAAMAMTPPKTDSESQDVYVDLEPDIGLSFDIAMGASSELSSIAGDDSEQATQSVARQVPQTGELALQNEQAVDQPEGSGLAHVESVSAKGGRRGHGRRGNKAVADGAVMHTCCSATK